MLRSILFGLSFIAKEECFRILLFVEEYDTRTLFCEIFWKKKFSKKIFLISAYNLIN